MDRHTIFAMQAGLLLFMSGVILLAFRTQRSHRRNTAGYWFATAFASAGVGLGLQAERGIISPVLSILFGNGLFMLFGAFLNRGIARTTGLKKDQFWWLVALMAAAITNFAYFTFWSPNLPVRVVEAVFVMAVEYATCVVMLLRIKDSVIRPAMRAMAMLLVGHMAAQLLRVIVSIWVHDADAWFSWIGASTIAGLALSMIWIDQLRLQARLEETAMTDPLTGLFNRRALEMLAPRQLQRLARDGGCCSALMMDIDRFKEINDRLGHAAGDSSLCAVAGALQAGLRSSDIATRLGGDEFFVLLPEADEKTAAIVVARLRNAIDQLRLQTMGGEVFNVSISIGQITQQSPDMTVEDLLHASDIVLYREKQVSRARQGLATMPQADAGTVSHVRTSRA